MTLRKAQNAIDKVQARLESPFTAKKEKTPLLNALDNVCYVIHTAICDAVEGCVNEYEVILNIPMSFGQMRASRVRDVDSMVKAIEDYAPEYKDHFLQCEGLYREVTAAAVPLTKAEEEKKILKQQECMLKAQKEDGLRFVRIYVQGYFCHNEQGTMWTRYDWYLKYSRTAYSTIMDVVSDQFKFWQDNGRPDMTDWDYGDISTFYS